MNKKTYISPELEIVLLNTNHQLLAGSQDALLDENPQSNEDALSPANNMFGF